MAGNVRTVVKKIITVCTLHIAILERGVDDPRTNKMPNNESNSTINGSADPPIHLFFAALGGTTNWSHVIEEMMKRFRKK